jgi:hypothetical protein
MSALINLSIKGKDGYKNYTISISDETNQYGQNVVMYEQQSKEERENKVPKKYIGNGNVIWNDGKITNADKKEVNNTQKVEENNDLPF